jgi:hypothetical protein
MRENAATCLEVLRFVISCDFYRTLKLKEECLCRKVAGSRSNEVNEYFSLSYPFGRTKPWRLLSI